MYGFFTSVKISSMHCTFSYVFFFLNIFLNFPSSHCKSIETVKCKYIVIIVKDLRPLHFAMIILNPPNMRLQVTGDKGDPEEKNIHSFVKQ